MKIVTEIINDREFAKAVVEYDECSLSRVLCAKLAPVLEALEVAKRRADNDSDYEKLAYGDMFQAINNVVKLIKGE